MPTYHYTVTEYEAARPWVIVGPLRRMDVDLYEGEDFNTWAAQAWPAPRFRAQLEPEPQAPWPGAGDRS